VQELDRKVTMAEQIATMRYRMNAFMFWFMIFFCPLLSFAFSSFLRFLLEEVLCETTRFEAWSLGFIFFFIFPIREIFFSNWASDFARFLNHDAKIRNPDLSGVR
jgi:4-amino-4-deoxy-L-arabinose transferase